MIKLTKEKRGKNGEGSMENIHKKTSVKVVIQIHRFSYALDA